MTYRQVRAQFTDRDITAYQAYSPEIAEAALAAGTFVAPFSRGRMTWIKPSFLWMMYRAGWGSKPGQERILAVRIRRDGFEWALAHACLSHYEPGTCDNPKHWADRLRASPVRIQWDPERSLSLAPQPYRAIQIGLSGEAVGRYVDQWITGITDVTPLAHSIHRHVRAGEVDAARSLLPAEQPYPLPTELNAIIGTTCTPLRIRQQVDPLNRFPD